MDLVPLNAGAVQGNSEMRLLVHVQPIVFHTISVERAEIVRYLDFIFFKRIADVGEGQICPGVHEILRAVFCELACRIEEFAPIGLPDDCAVVVQVGTRTIAVESHHIARKNRIKHCKAAAVGRRCDHGAVNQFIQHDVVKRFRGFHQRPGDCRGILLQRAQEEPEVTVSANVIAIVVRHRKTLANRNPVLTRETFRCRAECLERLAQGVIGGMERCRGQIQIARAVARRHDLLRHFLRRHFRFEAVQQNLVHHKPVRRVADCFRSHHVVHRTFHGRDHDVAPHQALIERHHGQVFVLLRLEQIRDLIY